MSEPRSGRTGSIYDLGYRPYDGARLGRRYAVRSLYCLQPARRLRPRPLDHEQGLPDRPRRHRPASRRSSSSPSPRIAPARLRDHRATRTTSASSRSSWRCSAPSSRRRLSAATSATARCRSTSRAPSRAPTTSSAKLAALTTALFLVIARPADRCCSSATPSRPTTSPATSQDNADRLPADPRQRARSSRRSWAASRWRSPRRRRGARSRPAPCIAYFVIITAIGAHPGRDDDRRRRQLRHASQPVRRRSTASSTGSSTPSAGLDSRPGEGWTSTAASTSSRLLAYIAVSAGLALPPLPEDARLMTRPARRPAGSALERRATSRAGTATSSP